MGNHTSAPHEPLDRAQVQNHDDFKTKSSVRTSFRRVRATGTLSPTRGGMERLRRSFRESFRRRKADPPESARPHVWHADEAAVRAGTCTFPVKYLGCVEVFESRGMQICENALKLLRNSRRRPVRAILNVSGDGLRVVEEETKGLIVDQTIEKVSFCAPDRNHERGFSYICRDGTTRRWMCHGFVSCRDSGERLSHAVGCAFAACLERKQRRDKECAVSMSIDAASQAFTRQGSFRQSSITEKTERAERLVERPQPKAAHNPFAVERPHAAPHMLVRQGSIKGLSTLNNTSPFKRQMSLRIHDLPSDIERRAGALKVDAALLAQPVQEAKEEPVKLSQPNQVTSLTQVSQNNSEAVSAMCAALSRQLRALSEEPVEARSLPAPEAWLCKVAPVVPVAPLIPLDPLDSPEPPPILHSTNPFLAH